MDNENQTPQGVNDQFYAETAPGGAPVGPSADLAPVPAPTAPVGLSLMREDGRSFTASGPFGVQTFPKDETHQEIYNRAKGAVEFQSERAAAQAVPTTPVSAPAPVPPTQTAPRQEPTSIQPMEGNGGKPYPKPDTSAAPGQLGGGAQVVNLTDTTRNVYSPADMKKFKEAETAVINNEIAKNNAETALHGVQQSLADKQAIENANFIDAEIQRRHLEDVEKGERMAKYNSAKDAFSGLRVDSNRLWNNMATGDKMMASVAMALGGLGGAMQGNAGNVYWNVIERNIDRDIDEQKANINIKGKALDAERTAYQDFLSATGDERAARLATKELAMQKIASEFESKIGAATNDAQKASLAAGLAGIQEKQAQFGLELNKVLQTTKPTVVTKGSAEPLVPTEISKMTKAESKLDELDQVIKDLQSGDVQSGLLEDYKARIAGATGFATDPKQAALRSEMATLFNDKTNEWFGGALSENELANAKKAMAEYSDNPKVAVAKLRSVLDRATKEANDQRNALSGTYKFNDTQSNYLKSYRTKFEKQR